MLKKFNKLYENIINDDDSLFNMTNELYDFLEKAAHWTLQDFSSSKDDYDLLSYIKNKVLTEIKKESIKNATDAQLLKIFNKLHTFSTGVMKLSVAENNWHEYDNGEELLKRVETYLEDNKDIDDSFDAYVDYYYNDHN